MKKQCLADAAKKFTTNKNIKKQVNKMFKNRKLPSGNLSIIILSAAVEIGVEIFFDSQLSKISEKLIFDPLTNELTPNHDKSILELNRDSTDSEYLSKYVP
jgi:uncharacterized protein YaiL (DUF2058 family)